MVVENLRVDVTPGGVPLVIHVSQYDAGLRQFVFTPYDKGVAMAKIAGATVAVEATKPDGYAVQHPCTYNNDGTITYTLQEQLAACDGQVWSKLTWRDSNGNILGAKAIVWAVDMAGIEDGAIVSDSDLPLIEQAAEFAGEYEQKVAEMIAEMQIVPGQVVIDGTLTVQGAAADAKATGDRLADLQSDLSKIVPGLSEEAKAALLDCFAHTTWDNGSGASYYIDKLRQALEATETLVRISVAVDDDAIFTTGTAVEDLRDYIVVTAIYNTGKSITVNDYSITGNALAHGENTITISYEGVENTITIVAYTARAALISDVASSIGYSNLSCNNGNFSADSLTKFSILQFNTAIKRMKFNINNDGTGTLTSNVWYAIKKDGNDYYCATGEASANLFSLNQDGTAYTASSVTGIDFVKEGNGIKDTSIKTFILDGDTLKIKGDNGSLTITPANCIGVWGQPGTMVCPVNVVVYE